MIFFSGTCPPKTHQTFFSQACWAFSHERSRKPHAGDQNKLRTDNSRHGMRLTVRGLGGAVCFLRADLTGRAPYMPFKSRVARCRVSGSHRNPGLIPLTRTGLPTWQNCCWKILQEQKLSRDMLKYMAKTKRYVRLHLQTPCSQCNMIGPTSQTEKGMHILFCALCLFTFA